MRVKEEKIDEEAGEEEWISYYHSLPPSHPLPIIYSHT
jgi:hypothetical protein